MKKVLLVLLLALISATGAYAQFSVGKYTKFPNNKLGGNTWKPALAFARDGSKDMLVLYVNQNSDYAQFDAESRLLVKFENDSTYKLPILMEYGVEKDYDSSYNKFSGVVTESSTYTCYDVTKDFVNSIINNDWTQEGCQYPNVKEGVVIKRSTLMKGQRLPMCKVKTNWWINKLHANFSEEECKRLE